MVRFPKSLQASSYLTVELLLDKPSGASMTNVATMHLEELKKELDEYKELSANRLQEIDKLNDEKAQAMTEIDKLKMDVSI